MRKFKYFFKIGINYLKNDYKYAALAIICIAFSTLSIVTLRQLSDSILNVINLNPVIINGGDIAISYIKKPVSQEDIDYFKNTYNLEKISTTIELLSPLLAKSKNSIQSVYYATGINTSNYPAVG